RRAACRETSRTTSPDALQPLSEARLEAIRPDGGQVEESSAESFPASDPPAYTTAAATREAPPAAPVATAARPAGDPAIGYPTVSLEVRGQRASISTGSVAIAAITSCTDTSNPTVMIGAGLLARNAVQRGLRVPPTVKTSLAPGSKAVTAYLENARLMGPLEPLRVTHH